MEDDEKKKRKKDENPYQLKEEFPDTINIKPKDEQPEAPAVEAPAEETPTEGQPEAPAAEAQEVETPENPTPATTQTQTTAAESAEQTEETQPKEEVSPAPTTEETAVETTDETDVDGATGVVSQETGNAEQAETEETDLTDTEEGDEDNDETELAESNVNPDEVAVAKGGTPNGGDLTSLGNAAGVPTLDNTQGGGATQGNEAGDESSLPQPPAIPNAEDDETAKGQEEYNKAIEDAYLGEIQYDENGNPLTDENGVVRKGGYFNWYDNLMKEREEYDRQRQERDSRNAFWRSIGEVGASLVNLLGVSGAFSGRNAYGRGAYSSMQKFDLTTPKLTDKMWADIDKRKERMDALKEKRGELDLKFKEAMAKGKLDLGKGKGAAADKQYTREYTQYKDQLSAQQAANQLEYLKGKAAADAVLAEIKMKNDKEIAKIRAKGRSGGGGGGNTKTPITLNLTYPTADGEKSFTSRYDVLEAAMKVNFGRLADCLARALGYNDYAGFSADKPTDYRYNGDNQIEKSLAEYFKTTKYVAMNNISNEKMTELLNWAYNALGLTQEGGELIENAVKAYAPIVDVMNAMNGGGGGGDDTEDEDEDFPDYDGMLDKVTRQ